MKAQEDRNPKSNEPALATNSVKKVWGAQPAPEPEQKPQEQQQTPDSYQGNNNIANKVQQQ